MLESTKHKLKGEMTKLERRTTDAEDQISATEDSGRRYERAIRYLLHREMDLTAKCENLQTRSRRNNLKIYGFLEGCEGKDGKAFVKVLILVVLQPVPEVNLQTEGAH